MKSKITLMFLAALLAASCKKTTEVDVTVSTSGKLIYKLLDDNGKGLPGVKVSLFDNINTNYNSSVLLETRTTDQNGAADFGDLNPATYLIVPDSPAVNNIKYPFREYVQVRTGNTNERSTKVTDFSASVNITVKSYYNNTSSKNVGVAMIPSNKYSYSNTIIRNIESADFKGTTNDAGAISFKIPANKSYLILVYNTNTNVSLTTSSIYSVEKGGVMNLPISVYSY